MKKPVTLVVLPSSVKLGQIRNKSSIPFQATAWSMPGYETQKPAWMEPVPKASQRTELPAADLRASEFLAMLAHELRNPLEPIRSAASLLARLRADGPLIEQKAVAVIQRQVHHLTRLVDDLLDVSRLNYGKIQLHSEAILISTVIDAAIDANNAFALSHRLRFQVDLPPGPLWVMGDAVRLTQIFSNLLHNAAKFSVDGGVVVVRIRASETNRHVAISVRDEGIGIAAEFIGSVFDLFAQEQPSAAHGCGGLGIGLSVVRTLTELHGGKVAAFSGGVAMGCEFVVTLPTVLAPLRLIVAPPPAAAGKVRHVLLVDDNRDVAESMRALLEMEGHTVSLAFDGRSALDQVARLKPDIVILDIGLPDMSGYEVALRIKADLSLPAPVLIAMTGYGREQDRLQASDAGFDHHFVKPADHLKLLEILAQ